MFNLEILTWILYGRTFYLKANLRVLEILLRSNLFDTPDGIGLRNLTRINYRELRYMVDHGE